MKTAAQPAAPEASQERVVVEVDPESPTPTTDDDVTILDPPPVQPTSTDVTASTLTLDEEASASKQGTT